MIVLGELLSDLKDYLNISYDDDRENRMLSSALQRGMSVIDEYAGADQDYMQEGAARQLLFDYCRYVRSQATEMFEINYRHDLNALREKMEIEVYRNAKNKDEP